jgi:hypothetical protein
MRPVPLAPVPFNASTDAKVDWCIKQIQAIVSASHQNDPNIAADGFEVDNLTITRSFDADSTTLAEVADVLGTFLSDLKNRGSKREV